MHRWYFIFAQWFKRDLEGRYRGSWLGMLWPLIHPLSQVAIFTLILHGFIQIRWPTAVGSGSPADTGGAWVYALNVLAGLTVFNFFAEVLGRSPVAVLSQPNLVTRVKFPLWLLPVVTVGAALVHVGVGATVLVVASALGGTLSLEMAWLPLWLIPVVLYGLSFAMLLSCLGVYVRDIGQAMSAVTSLLMFVTPIFYPMTSVPANMRVLFELNPVAWATEALRGFLLNGHSLDLGDWTLHFAISAGAALLAIGVFSRLQEGFADVL